MQAGINRFSDIFPPLLPFKIKKFKKTIFLKKLKTFLSNIFFYQKDFLLSCERIQSNYLPSKIKEQ
jgi:hypothetical protein